MRAITNFAPLWGPDNPTANPRKGKDTEPGADDERDQDQEQMQRQFAEIDLLRTVAEGHHQRLDPHHVAGHAPGDPMPSDAYPHQSMDDTIHRTARNDLERQLASLNPPLTRHRLLADEEASASLQSQHAAVMSAIVHTCLLRGDYDRAAHAFGTLLRMTGGSHTLALRANGNWGIGAEILLQQGLAASRGQPDLDDDEDAQIQRPLDLSKAKEYYEALILQYPYRKQNPTALDARTFYQALFGVMIYEATAKRRSDTPDAAREQLRSARSIAGRMDDVLVNPPYDIYAPLLRLRGMIALWTADLITSLIPEMGSGSDSEDDDQDTHVARELTNTERAKAASFFERCARAGGSIPAHLTRPR